MGNKRKVLKDLTVPTEAVVTYRAFVENVDGVDVVSDIQVLEVATMSSADIMARAAELAKADALKA